jgi:hypothetical protein
MNAPLIAAGADAFIIVKLLALIFILGVPALGRLLASMQNAQPKLQPPPPRPDAKVSDEIEAFLQRVSANRGPAGNVAAAARKPETPLRAELVVEDQDEPVGAQVGKQVEKYLDTGEFSRRSAQLGEEVAQTDAQVDKRMKKVFDHDVSKLAKKPGEAAVPTGHMTDEAAPAAAIVMPPLSLGLLFGDPDAIRQAIIVSEILRRPEERW